MNKTYFCGFFLHSYSTEGPIKSPSSVCQSVCPSLWRFSQKLLNSFFYFWHDGRQLENLKTGKSSLLRENSFFAQVWVKRVQNGPKIGFFWDFLKKLSFVFLGNNLKWKIILLLFHHQSHIWQNCSSQCCQKIKFQDLLKCNISRKK